MFTTKSAAISIKLRAKFELLTKSKKIIAFVKVYNELFKKSENQGSVVNSKCSILQNRFSMFAIGRNQELF